LHERYLIVMILVQISIYN